MTRPKCSCVGKISPSAIDTARACLRKWGWRHIAKVPEEPNRFAAAGTQIHAALEAYYSDPHLPPRLDTSSDEGRILIPALAHLPPRGPHVRVEGHFSRGPFHGYKDLEVRGFVLDLKTTSNLLYAKTPEDLRKDPQALIYAWDHLEEHPDLDEVTCRWVYVVRDPKRPRAMPVDATLSRAYTYEAIEEFVSLAGALQRHREAHTDVLDLVPSPVECDRYRGCPHVDRCADITPERKVSAFMALQDILSRVAAVNPPNPNASTPAPTSTPTPTSTPAPPGKAPPGFYWALPPGGAWQILPDASDPPGPIPDGTEWVRETSAEFGAVALVRHLPAPEPAPEPTPEPTPAKRGPGRPRKDPVAVATTPVVVDGSDAYEEGVRVLCAGLAEAVRGLELVLLGRGRS